MAQFSKLNCPSSLSVLVLPDPVLLDLVRLDLRHVEMAATEEGRGPSLALLLVPDHLPADTAGRMMDQHSGEAEEDLVVVEVVEGRPLAEEDVWAVERHAPDHL